MKYQPFVFWAIALIIGILLQYYFEFNTNIQSRDRPCQAK